MQTFTQDKWQVTSSSVSSPTYIHTDGAGTGKMPTQTAPLVLHVVVHSVVAMVQMCVVTCLGRGGLHRNEF